MCLRTCELVESVAPYPKTSTAELNQSGCHKRCPRGVPKAKQSCLHDLFGFFYRCRCHEHVSLLNLLHRIPEELSQSGCHKRCPRGVPEASEGGVEPTGGVRGKFPQKWQLLNWTRSKHQVRSHECDRCASGSDAHLFYGCGCSYWATKSRAK